jgi:hypothetical protein
MLCRVAFASTAAPAQPTDLPAIPEMARLAKISVPLLGTNLVFTPEISGVRSIVHLILFGLCLYFGFIKTPEDSDKDRKNQYV